MRLLRVYWPFLAAAFVLSVFMGVGAHILLARTAPSWEATVTFQILPATDAEGAVGAATGVGGERELTKYMETQVQVMQSDRLLIRAIDEPTVQASSWASGFMRGGVIDGVEALKDLRDRVTARSIPDTQLVVLRVSMARPEDSANIANAVSDVFLNDNLSGQTREAQASIERYQRQLTGLRQDINALDVRIENLIGSEELTSADTRSSVHYIEAQQIQNALTNARGEIAQTRQTLLTYEQARDNPGGIVYPEAIRETAERSPIAATLEQRIETERAYLRADEETFGAEHRAVKNRRITIRALEEHRQSIIQKEMREAFDVTIESLRNTILRLEAGEQTLLTRLEDVQGKLNELQRALAEKDQLDTERKNKVDAAKEIDQRISALELSRQRGARVRVLSAADIPDSRAFPQIVPIVGLTVVLVTGAVAGVIVLKEIREQRIRTPQDVALIPRTRVLGIVPEIGLDPAKPQRVETACIDRPHGAVAETVRQLRNAILKACRDRHHKSIVVSSGMPGSGTTSVIANLGANAAMTDLRVLIIDANTRRPAVHRVFDRPVGPGLAEILRGETTLDAAVGTTDVEGLSILAAGFERTNSFERLNTPSMAALLEEAKQKYDLILIDTPPAVVASDGLALATVCDASVLVVRAYSEKRGLIARVRNQLGEAHAEFLGVVVNAIRPSAGGYFKRNFRATMEYQQGDEVDAPVAAGAEDTTDDAAATKDD
ncbi:MAG: polysaccharide biosynthesis tyrosine autokinase [Planctomycetota bacterium]